MAQSGKHVRHRGLPPPAALHACRACQALRKTLPPEHLHTKPHRWPLIVGRAQSQAAIAHFLMRHLPRDPVAADALIEVHAASLKAVDILARRGGIGTYRGLAQELRAA